MSLDDRLFESFLSGLAGARATYRPHFVCYIRGQSSDLPRHKSRVVLGVDLLHQLAHMVFLFATNKMFMSLAYAKGWGSTCGDSIFHDGPEIQMQRLLSACDGVQYLWDGRDLKAYDGSIPAPLVTLALRVPFETVGVSTWRSSGWLLGL